MTPIVARPPAHYDELVLYGWFHRLFSATQTQGAARSQLCSGQIWGRPSRFSGDVPLAQAHPGRLPDGARGVEFLALAPPDKRYGRPEWRVPRSDRIGQPLVWREYDPILEQDVVKVRVAITRVHPMLP